MYICRFATVVVGSESSSRLLLERLVHKDLHGMLPSVSYCTKAALERLDPMPKKETTVPPGTCRQFFNVLVYIMLSIAYSYFIKIFCSLCSNSLSHNKFQLVLKSVLLV
jgi:hypothetical protein